MDEAGVSPASALAVLPEQRVTPRPLPPAPWDQMPAVGSPNAPYPPPPPGTAPPAVPGITLKTGERDAALELLRRSLADTRRWLQEAETARDFEVQARGIADAEVTRQRAEIAELVARIHWFETTLAETDQQAHQWYEHAQHVEGQLRALGADAAYAQQEAARELALADQRTRDAIEAAKQQIEESELRSWDAIEAAHLRAANAEQRAQWATDRAAQYVEEADARWAELANEAAMHESTADELRRTVADQRAEFEAITGPLGETIARLREELAAASSDRDLARRECVELEAELNRLLYRPTEDELAIDPAPEPAEPAVADDYPVSLTPGLDALQWQRDALAAWGAADHRGVVEAVAGADITRLAQWAIGQALDEGMKVLVLAPNADHVDAWHDELRDTLPIHRVGKHSGRSDARSGEFNVVVATAEGAAKDSIFGLATDVLVIALDVDDYATPELSVALDEIYDWRLGLTDCCERGDDGIATYITPYFGQMIFRLGYQQALEDGAVAGYDIALVAVTLRDDERRAYDEADRLANELTAKLVNNFAIPAAPAADFDAEVDALAHGWAGAGRSAARGYQKVIAQRDEILATCVAKQAVLHTLDGLNARVLVLARSDSRADVTDGQADLGIVLTASRSRREMGARLGQLIGRESDGRFSRLVVVYAEDTVEDDGDATYLSAIAPYANSVHRFDGNDPTALLHFATSADGTSALV